MTYLCGGINGLPDSDCRDWREVAKQLLKTKTLDPMRRDYRGKEDESVRAIVFGDLWDIARCRFILVNATRPSWGTAMEIVYAFLLAFITRKKIVCWVGASHISPWLRFHATVLFQELNDACDWINRRVAG